MEKDHYRKDSPVGKLKDKIKEIVSAHWNYVKRVIETSMDKKKMFTYDEVMKMREWDYTSAATHFYGHGLEDAEKNEPETLLTFAGQVARHKKWALETFGPGLHTAGLSKHITKELEEIKDDPRDTEEWIDIIILAMEGAWRTGASPETVSRILDLKQTKNENRVWPDWRKAEKGAPFEHIKETPTGCDGYKADIEYQAEPVNKTEPLNQADLISPYGRVL